MMTFAANAHARSETRADPHRLEERAERVIGDAQAAGLTIATVESCTAGALAALLGKVAGAGEVLHGGFVVYSKPSKITAVGVPAEMIAQHTAVSAEVAEAMARGALERSPADCVIAITGVVGPNTDDDGNPTGLVYFACVRRDGRAETVSHTFEDGSPDWVRAKTLETALDLLHRCIAD